MSAARLLWRNANQSTLESLRGESPGQYDIRLGRSAAVTSFFADLPTTDDHDGQRIEITTERSPVTTGDGEALPWDIAVRRMGEDSKRRDWYIRAQRPETAHPLWRPGVGPLAETQPGSDFVVLLRKDDLFYAGWMRGEEVAALPEDLRDRMLARDIDAVELGQEAAEAIGALLTEAPIDLGPGPDQEVEKPVDEIEQGMVEAEEGRKRTVQHVRRERSSWLRRKKIEAVAGQPRCEACDFDFKERYGERGEGFIECHHTIPVSELDPGKLTRVEDLALLCPNCHRMIHASRPWISVDKLRELLAAAS